MIRKAMKIFWFFSSFSFEKTHCDDVCAHGFLSFGVSFNGDKCIM